MRSIILLVFVIAFVLNVAGSPVDAEEDDEDLIKELEQLLKGKPSSPEQGNYEPEEKELLNNKQPEEDFGGGGGEREPEAPEESFTEGEPAPAEVGGRDQCICKKYFECNVEGEDSKQGAAPSWNSDNPKTEMELDIRLGDTSQCGHYLNICCDNVRDNVSSIRNPQYKHSTCGKRNPSGVGFKITGDENHEAQFGEFPWMTAIVSPEKQQGKGRPLNVFVCGGSLIHPKVVLTAAHCIKKKTAQELTVRLGEWDTQTSDELYRHRDHSVQRIIIHEDFYIGALYNDIALLILKEETEISPHIDTVCLPPTNVNFDGQRCFASGWGRDSFGKEGNYQVILKKLDLPAVPRDSCEYSLRKTRLGRYFNLHSSFVCAGGERGKDTCSGDGGSPLVCKIPGSDSYVQYGIVAWGIGCGENGVPGVYVNVPMFVPWITKKMAEMRLETKYFKLARSTRAGK